MRKQFRKLYIRKIHPLVELVEVGGVLSTNTEIVEMERLKAVEGGYSMKSANGSSQSTSKYTLPFPAGQFRTTFL